MKAEILSLLIGAVLGQQDTCMYQSGDYTLNLTYISHWTLELETPDHFYYYTPCRNGLQCHQGNANYYNNAAQYKQGINACSYYLSVDHHERASYSFYGASWRFQYEDGELCEQTQEPRRTTIYYHCNNVNNQVPAFLEAVNEPRLCDYTYSIASTLACVPANDHNANCQWRIPDGQDSYYYLDLSELKGTNVHYPLGSNGYEMYYSPCGNDLHCYQQHQSSVMSIIDNRQTGTCEHSLAIWEDGRVQPARHVIDDVVHWSFHYWNGEKCSNGQQGEETIRWFCDPKVETFNVMGTGSQGDCQFFMNVSSKAACESTEPKWMDAKALFQKQ